eukprot:UN25101
MPMRSSQNKRRRISSPSTRSKGSRDSKVFPASKYEQVEPEPLKSEKGASKWWEVPPYEGEQKWTTLRHNGVVFAPPYEPHGIRMKYDEREIDLTPEQEECATWFAAILQSDHAKNPVFCKNFFNNWKRLLRHEKSPIRHPEMVDFALCDFTPIYDWTVSEKEKLKERRKTKAYKEAKKSEKDYLDARYGYAVVDGILEKVGNYKVEPPGLFRGRGAHPKTGMIKKRLWPEDITLNIGRGQPIPKCPIEGHRWKGVVHDNTVTYIAKWDENINGARKFVYLHSSSRFKGRADMEKYEKARKLKKCIGSIRHDYTMKLSSKSRKVRQLATAVWMIDILAIRVGNEKDTDEVADTVGVCSLRKEHLELKIESGEVVFDFLGKDSMRYYNVVKFPELVFRNMQEFLRQKKIGDDLFEEIVPGDVNDYLKQHMDGLSAKVFRTYNASFTLQKELAVAFTGADIPVIGKLSIYSSVDDKVYFYNTCNTRVAILCNHQRSVPKSFGDQMAKMEKKMEEKEEKLRQLQRELKWAKGRGNPDPGWKRKDPSKVETQIKKQKQAIRKLELNKKLKSSNKEVALGTSKINYMDPRISVAFCKKIELPIEKSFLIEV